MRVLFTTQPGAGHFHPLVPLARALVAAGHAVAFACAGAFRPEVERVGFRAYPLGGDWLTADLERAFPAVRDIPPGPDRYAWVRAHIFAGVTARDAVPDLLALAGTWRPDLIVRDAAEYGGCLAAECLGLPHAVVRTDAGSASYRERVLVAGPLAAARAACGLPPDPETTMPFRFLQLSFAGALDDPAESVAPTLHRLRPLAPAPADDGCGMAPAWLDGLPARPTVYATLGTVYNRLPTIFPAILAGLRDEPVNLILTIGRDQDPARFGPQPPTSASSGTSRRPSCCRGAIWWSRMAATARLRRRWPTDCRWCWSRSPPTSRRMPGAARRSGSAASSCPTTARPKRSAPPRAWFWADPRYGQRAARLRAEVQALPGLDHALALLERLARERAPQPA